MNRVIKSAAEGYLDESLELVERVFAESEGEESGKLVRTLVEEIRSKRFYLPELDLVMLDEYKHVIGYAMFSRFHLECLMVKELVSGALEKIKGMVDYSDYDCLS